MTAAESRAVDAIASAVEAVRIAQVCAAHAVCDGYEVVDGLVQAIDQLERVARVIRGLE